MSDPVIRRVTRAVEDARNVAGMVCGMPKVTIDASDAERLCLMAEIARAQEGGSGEAIGEITSVEGSIMFEPGRYRQDAVFKELYPIGTKLYTHPSASVPDGGRIAVLARSLVRDVLYMEDRASTAAAELEELLTITPQPAQQGSMPEGWKVYLKDGDVILHKESENWTMRMPDEASDTQTAFITEFLRDLLTTTPQPADSWIKCSERLPTEADADCDDEIWFCCPEGNICKRHYKKVQIDIHLDCRWMPTGLKRPTPPSEGAE